MFGSLRPTVWLFAALALALVAIKLVFDFYPGAFPVKEQAAAFTFPLIGAVVLVAFLGLLADRGAGLPEPFGDLTREKKSSVVAVASGAIYGLITIGYFVWETRQAPINAGDWDHLALPWSIPFYAFGAILLEFMLRLGVLCILFWLVHVLLLRGRLRAVIFFSLAGIVALYEVWPTMSADLSDGRWDDALLALVGPLYLSNVFEGWLLWRYGWFSPIVFRLAFYSVWHLAFGGLAIGLYAN